MCDTDTSSHCTCADFLCAVKSFWLLKQSPVYLSYLSHFEQSASEKPFLSSSRRMSASPEPVADSPVPDVDQDEDPVPAREEIPEAANLSDDDSVLSDIDEDQFKDFNPDSVAVDDRPSLAIDKENLKLVGRHKRRREEGVDGESKKKKKEGRREKKSRKKKDSDDGFSGGEEIDGKRNRRRQDGGERKERKSRKQVEEENEESLDPATSMFYVLKRLCMGFIDANAFTCVGRRRALDRAMDEALKKPTKRRARKADGIVRPTPRFNASRALANRHAGLGRYGRC